MFYTSMGDLTFNKSNRISGNVQDIDKFSRRLVKVTKQHVEEAKQLLKLMGIPFVEVSFEILIDEKIFCLNFFFRHHAKQKLNVPH